MDVLDQFGEKESIEESHSTLKRTKMKLSYLFMSTLGGVIPFPFLPFPEEVPSSAGMQRPRARKLSDRTRHLHWTARPAERGPLPPSLEDSGN